MSINAPGLKQIKRQGRIDLYWVKDEAPLFADYKPATVRIHVDMSDPQALEKIERICRHEQDTMLLWLDDASHNDKERLKPKFNGTFGSLCDLYESDDESGFADLQANTKLSYQDSLKIIRNDIGLRRIDLVAPKYFRTCYREWKKPVQHGSEERVRRAHGAIGQIKIILGYGIEANHFASHCERLLKAMSKMRFAKNPPRGITMTFEQAKAITCEALDAADSSTALVQALQYECFLRQIDIIGKWRVEPATYVLKPGEIRRGKKVWHGMTVGMILNDEKLLRVRTSKTAQFVAHSIEKCELVMLCLEKLGPVELDQPVACRADGFPWADHRDFGKHWRTYANKAEVPKNVWNMDNRASGITEATAAGAAHDDLASGAAHASKSTTRKIYMRGAKEISERVQKARQSSRHGKST
ncbi:MAG: hypothetical protein WBA62_00360 [Xanthobacteraceae bacterium]